MSNQVYLGSGEITESLSKVAEFKVIRTDEELAEFLASLPTQDELLEKLKQNGLGPEKIYDLSKNNPYTPISKQLIDFGLEISSLKKAGLRPNSIFGLEYIVRGPSDDENGVMYFTQDQVPHFVNVCYLVNILGFTIDELLQDGFNKTYVKNELKNNYL